MCSGHTAAPAIHLWGWLCCHLGKNPVVPSYVPEACQSVLTVTVTASASAVALAPPLALADAGAIRVRHGPGLPSAGAGGRLEYDILQWGGPSASGP